MADRLGRTALLVAILLSVVPSQAFADWYFTPFIGTRFGASYTLLDLDLGLSEETKGVALGGSVALISGGLLGVEADYAYFPNFFRSGRFGSQTIIESNRVQTLTGSVMVMAPLSLTRESLRPYVLGGVGWMEAVSEDLRLILPVDSTFVALNLGAGAIGMLSDRAGLRFDIRRLSNLDRDPASGFSIGTERLSFWRATVGVTIRR